MPPWPDLTEGELGWITGIFEGEGSTGAYGHAVQARIQMTDLDVMEKVQRLVPSPHGLVHVRKEPGRKQKYQWGLHQGVLVRRFLTLILPLLHERRSAQARKVLLAIEGRPGLGHARKSHCVRGHALTGENIKVVGNGRRCRACQNEANRLYRDRLVVGK